MSVPNPIVLLLEAQPGPDGKVCEAFLGAGMADCIRIVKDPGDAMAYLQGQGAYSNRESFPVPGLILMSLKGTEKAGWSLLQWIREQDPLKGIPLVAMVDSTESRTVRKAYELGVHSCLLTPLAPNELARMVTMLNAS